uniref:Uncharacterized protein n=1 Tax=Arundo donax TaxID=35708 RepID=A0A0A9AVP0_ARUDO
MSAHSHRSRGRCRVPRPRDVVPIRESGSNWVDAPFRAGSRIRLGQFPTQINPNLDQERGKIKPHKHLRKKSNLTCYGAGGCGHRGGADGGSKSRERRRKGSSTLTARRSSDSTGSSTRAPPALFSTIWI